MAKDPHAERKKAILDRAKKTPNKKVQRYATKDLLEKIDQAGPHAGVWLESLESDFDALSEKPQGKLRSFNDRDFDALFAVMFGYQREDRGKAV